MNYKNYLSDHNSKVKASDKNNQNIAGARSSNLSAGSGPFQCDRKFFTTIWEMEKRRANRDWHNAFVFQIKITINSGESERLEEVAYLLKKTLKKTIRQSDIFCIWEKNRFLILLHEITADDIDKVRKRIEESFHQSLKKCPELDCWFNHKGRCRERSMPEGSRYNCKPPYSFSEKIDLESAFYPLQEDDLYVDKNKI